MNVSELKELLAKQYDNIFIFHPKFFDEFEELVGNSGTEEKVIKQFLGRLSAIIELGNIDSGPSWLEKLKKYVDLYSLHITAGRNNYRLLFTKRKNNKYFLTMFYERSGKKNSSYAPHVNIAIKRMSDF